MKISHYSAFIAVEKGNFIYNSLSNSLIKTESELFEKIKNFKTFEFTENDLKEDSETIDMLKKAYIIIENKLDDLLEYQAAIWTRRRVNDVHNITIAPTMDCNYRCYYCFETQVHDYISDDTISRISKYINKLTNPRHINLTWFGGEPLLAFNQIKILTKQLLISEDTTTNFNIITNGYYMDQNVVDELQNLKINSIQISIDGLYDQYNRVKSMKNDKNCFDTLIKNIDYFAEKNKDISLMIRVNLDKNLKEDFHKIVNFFIQRYPNNTNIFPHAAFLKNICNTTHESRACHFCNEKDKSEFAVEMFQKTQNKSFLYPDNNFCECAIRNQNSWAFGSDGSVYKCWENIGNNEDKVGFINEDGEIQITDWAKLNRFLYGADPLNNANCKECFYLPICYGGCPHQRILEEFENIPEEKCAKYCDYMDHYLKEYINSLI